VREYRSAADDRPMGVRRGARYHHHPRRSTHNANAEPRAAAQRLQPVAYVAGVQCADVMRSPAGPLARYRPPATPAGTLEHVPLSRYHCGGCMYLSISAQRRVASSPWLTLRAVPLYSAPLSLSHTSVASVMRHDTYVCYMSMCIVHVCAP